METSLNGSSGSSCDKNNDDDETFGDENVRRGFFGSIRSALTSKSGKKNIFRRKLFSKSVDLSEDALFYAGGGECQDKSRSEQGCICLKGIKQIPDTMDNLSRRISVGRNRFASSNGPSEPEATAKMGFTANFQVDYVNFLIPGMVDICSCPFYWGKMDRYEAEALLNDKPEGSFLLRDSAQDEFVFSVSFRRYSRTLHARIEETGHKFSFDCHDPGVHASVSVRGLLDHYKDPLSCMFFEPMLLFPVLRKATFSLQSLARSVICDRTTYDGVSHLHLPVTLKQYLREYHYRHKIGTRHLDNSNLG